MLHIRVTSGDTNTVMEKKRMTATAAVLTPEIGSLDRFARHDKTKIPKGGLYGMEVGSRLRQRREALGLKQEDVAERSVAAASEVAKEHGDQFLNQDPNMVHKGTFARVAYTNYENGEVVPGPEKIFTLAAILETTAKWLYFGDEPGGQAQAQVPQMIFNGHGFEESGRCWGLDADWLRKNYAGKASGAYAVAEIENRSVSLYPGDVALVDTEARPVESGHEEFVFAFAKSIMAGDLKKVDGGYQMFDEKGKPSTVASPQQIRILGRVLGSVGSSI